MTATVRILDAAGATAAVPALADVLVDCVHGGASVSFMAPLPAAKALAFWQGVASGVARGERLLLVAEDASGIVGTVQLVLDQPDNQPHRADVAKMLVHRRARRQGVAARLLAAAEAAARAAGKTVLVLDTVTGGDAERLLPILLDPEARFRSRAALPLPRRRGAQRAAPAAATSPP
jgi:GNAT superfamily N-acetyltransferase